MNKTKMILAGTGGAIGLVVLVLAFLVWQAFSAKTVASEGDEEEGTDGLETVLGRAQSLSRKPVYPSADSVAAIEKNREAIDEWCADGLSLASKGDRIYEKTTAPKFKTFLIDDAARIAAFPGAVDGKLVKPDFGFGPFKDYIAGSKMPSETELAELQRKWDDVATIAELFATNGVAELLDIQFKAVAKDEGPETKDLRRGKADKKGQRAKGKGQGPESDVRSPLSFSYAFTFAAKPAAFIRTLNALESSERFITVEDFAFSRPSDVIVEALGGDEKKTADSQASGRRGRRGRRGGGEAEASANKFAGAAEDAATRSGLVTDPLQDAPMTVTLTLTVCDFRSLEDEKTEKEGK